MEELRNLHNALKRSQIYSAFTDIPYGDSRISFLDLSCGRGGDLHKIYDAGYTMMVGIDRDADAIHEAKQRHRKSHPTFDANFRVHDLKEPLFYDDRFDTVSLQYALHYYFDKPESLRNLLVTVSTHLVYGGMFIGTYMDSRHLHTSENDLYEFEHSNTKGTTYGNVYKFRLKSGPSTTSKFMNRPHYFEKGVSEEYVIDEHELQKVALSVGLRLVSLDQPFADSSNDILAADRTFVFEKYVHSDTTTQTPPPHSDNVIVDTDEKEMKDIFPRKHGIDYTALIMTTEGRYSVSKRWASMLLVETIKKMLGPLASLHILDCTSNVGCDTIQLALNFARVTAVERDPMNFRALKNNINVFGLDNVDAIQDDMLNVIGQHRHYDVIYIDAPWSSLNDNELYIGTESLVSLYEKYKTSTTVMIFKVPRTYDLLRFKRRIEYERMYNVIFRSRHGKPLFSFVSVM